MKTDIAIIGAGPGGYATALRAAELGLSVMLIERDSRVGGTCLLRGCIPSKALITASRTVDAVHDGARMGIDAQLTSIDATALGAYRQHAVDTETNGLAGLLAARHITLVHGTAGLAPDGTVTVTPAPHESQVRVGASLDTLEDAGDAVSIDATDVVLATGGRPRALPGMPFGGRVLDSTAALELGTLPQRAIIVGAGSVALEFASMWRAMGADVTLLVRHDTPLSHAHRRSAVVLTRELKRRGITIVNHAHVTAANQTSDGMNVTVTIDDNVGGTARTTSIDGDYLLVAIGRDPNTAWIGQAGIELDDAGLVVTDEHGRTNRPHVWAVGDITPGKQLAHRAFEQGIVVAESIAGMNPTAVDERTVPSVVFTTPEFASVGRTTDEAMQLDGCLEVRETIYPVMGNARMVMEQAGGSLSIVTGRLPGMPDRTVVLGVHIVAPLASELIGQAEQLIGNSIALDAAARLIQPHPTFSEMLGEALLKADGRPLNTR
ncbi:pyridine nucleotide-disulfide oxidoreductase [Bifidobacterium gallicum DSM 20093 = LMG 11596]|nr:pyridine nucleotide-disulfide oxidoreductase [Bifidobacterium gallicum DSM 20093 = LMG 11596]